ncbi:MAG: diaminopropionate ammonia-lyase [Gammaproteobacteria bacterium]
MELVLNPRSHRESYTDAERRVLSIQTSKEALEEMRRWPGYAPTPLRTLGKLAASLGVQEILYKDEGARFGLGSFKALGGGYAATRELQRRLAAGFGIDATLTDIHSGKYAAELKTYTLCCATDGNHGLSVAHAARRFGCHCIVFMHRHASVYKAKAIARQGADVRRTSGNYDDSVRVARDVAGNPGYILIADTSESDFEQVPAEIIQGYSVMILEVLAQIERARLPTHVFVQGGVGGLAAAVAGSFAQSLGRERPTVVVVEPRASACLMESARFGVPARIGGDLTTVMEMLSCGEASPVAWNVLKHRADAFIAIDDEAARRAVDLLGDCNAIGEAAPIDVGPSGAAGLAGLIEIGRQSAFRESLKLGPEARVLTIGTEAGEIPGSH